MIDWTYIWIGVVFTVVMIRILKGIIPEMLFFGTVLGIIFSWHWEFTTFLGFPDLPMYVYKIGAGILLSWILYRAWLITATKSKSKVMRKITKLVFGKMEKLKI